MSSTVDPSGQDLKRFLQEDPGGPVVMLNLLKYAGEDGAAAYAEYARRIVPFLDEVGAEIVYIGDTSTTLVAPQAHDWDAVLLVRYPTREAFSRMVANPDYQEITRLRSAGLDAAVLQATVPWPDGGGAG